MGLHIISHNVRGFNSPQKRRKAFQYYKQMGVILLQETNFSSTSHPNFFDKSYKLHYFTTFESKARGVAIFIRNNILFVVKHVYKDSASRFVILQGEVQGRALTMTNVYAPNNAQSTFFKSFFQVLDRYVSTQLIVGGDFNFMRSLEMHQLIDTCRALNTGAKEYTHYSCLRDSYARLDYIFRSPILLANSALATINTCSWSDHQMVSFHTSHRTLTYDSRLEIK